jgi:hypothetical protein
LCRKRYWSKKYPLCLSGVKLISLRKTTNSNVSLEVAGGTFNGSPSASSPNLLTTAGHDDSSNTLNNSASKKELDNSTLILFARTDREKEEWYKLFKKSAGKKLLDSAHYLKQMQSRQGRGATIAKESTTPLKETAGTSTTGNIVKMSYSTTNDKLSYKIVDGGGHESEKNAKPGDSNGNNTTNNNNNQQMATTAMETQTDNGLLYDSSLNFMNTFLIRVFADFFTHKHWISLIKNKIQNKLGKIKVPYFMEELRIVDLDLGSVIPLIKQVSEPWYDERGLWVHFEIDYSGGLQMSLSTKLNLMKLKSSSTHHGTAGHSGSPGPSGSPAPFSFKNLINDEDNNNNSYNPLSSSPRASQPIDIGSRNGGGVVWEEGGGLSPRSSVSPFVKKNRSAIQHSDEEDSPESSGDEYVHTGFNDEENKLVET